MPIFPLPQFEADVKAALAEEDRAAYEALKAPKTMVVRFGAMKMVGEFPYGGSMKPGCGSKIVVRTFRGTEIGEMLTSTCPNNGCSKSVSRKDMLQYIQNSGGRDYPFFQDGPVEDRGPSSQKGAPVDGGARNVGVRSNEHVIAERARIGPRPTKDRVFHDDAVLPNVHGSPVRGEDGPR